MNRASIPPADAVRSAATLRADLEFLAHPLPAGMRDLLPAESEAQGRLLSSVMESFELHGYQRVSLPTFEYASVLERGLGAIDPNSVLRFVEPETGEVLALRPDVTPQVARLVATRFTERPGPVRLSYRGSVLRRQHQRARHDQQILQAGVEFVGAGGTSADVEVLRVTTEALRTAGLSEFVVDLGHGGIAPALLGELAEESRVSLLEALSQKDVVELQRRAEAAGLSVERVRALVELVSLQGGLDVFTRAKKLLGSTAAAPAVVELEEVARAAVDSGVVSSLVIDLGENRTIPYYTGMMFQVLAEGPGQAVASGGRYDDLFGRFGCSRPAAGAAVQIDHLRWALGDRAAPASERVLVLSGTHGEGGSDGAGSEQTSAAQACLDALRGAGIPAASYSGSEVLDYAQAWRYAHVLTPALGASSDEPRVEHARMTPGELVGEGSFVLSEIVERLAR